MPDPSERRRDALFKEYTEVASNFRLLTDIRFKLLALLPVAAVAAVALKGTGEADPTTAIATLGLSLFGAVVTTALLSYNARNDQLYIELVERAADIERSLGLPDGAFANRPTTGFTIPILHWRWSVGHGNSVALIYGASIALWLYGVFFSGAQLLFDRPAWWVVVGAAVLAGAITFAGGRLLRDARRGREKDMRTAARAAVELAKKHLGRGELHRCESSVVFRALCSGLLDSRVGISKAYRALCRDLREADPVSDDIAEKIVDELCDAPLDRDVAEKVGSRAAFYATQLNLEESRYYPQSDGESNYTTASYFVGLIVDLPPRWVLDCVTGRREVVRLAIPAERLVSHEAAVTRRRTTQG